MKLYNSLLYIHVLLNIFDCLRFVKESFNFTENRKVKLLFKRKKYLNNFYRYFCFIKYTNKAHDKLHVEWI